MHPLIPILKLRHARLDILLRKQMARAYPDALRIRTLKRGKLAMKDPIMALSRREVRS